MESHEVGPATTIAILSCCWRKKIRSKISQTAASIGVEGEVIPGAATSEVVFVDERAEIERLRREDTSLFVNAGEDTSAHSGEEYRQELRKGLERYGDLIEKLQWGSGSALQGGKAAGHFFCAYVGDRLFMRFMPSGSAPVVRDTLGCLRLINCPDGAQVAAEAVNTEAAYPAWQMPARTFSTSGNVALTLQTFSRRFVRHYGQLQNMFGPIHQPV